MRQKQPATHLQCFWNALKLLTTHLDCVNVHVVKEIVLLWGLN